MDKYIGKRLDGRYEIHELIGVGGMANVYRCTDTIDDREVAIKILKDEYLNNEEFIRRFKNESKAIAMLSHPNIVKVYDVSFGDMIQYIVMEYIDGITLKEYIDRQGIIEWKDALHLATQILKALQHAHECGIVHRDIKPQNIMLLQDGTIKVTDFGIARFSDKATRTMTEQAIGSVHYIAPEQARGDVTDGKTDIYSVGVMLYEMLTGKLPFDGDSAVTVALMQLQSTPKRPREVNPGIPIGLEQITMKAMQKQPSARYTSAAEMLSDIERFRLNPSIVFDYGKSFVDNQPTKFVNSIKDTKNDRTKVIQKPVSDERPGQDEPEEDDFVKEHKPSYYAVKGILIAAVAVCAIFFALAVFRGCNSVQAKDVDVPNYVGKTLVEAKEDNPNNFQFEIKSKYDESKEMGAILDQEPAGGSMKVKSGSTITLTVNGTDTEVSVPFVTNFSEKEALQSLKDKNFMAEVVYVENTKTPKGYTIDTFPKAGVKATIGSTVYIYVANGDRPEQVQLPSVTGLTLSEAKSELEELGLTVETQYDDDSKEAKDTVLGMSPLQYGKVDKGTVVTLTVSSGKGDKNTVNIYVDLPTNTDSSVEMTVIVDGVVDPQYSKTLVPKYNKTCTLEITGSGTSTVVIQLDGQAYREYSIDFSTSSVTTTATHDFVVETTAPHEPETEPETYPDEPQYPTDPYTPTGPVDNGIDY
ncbi:Stk1 family PASTA domain-containing Ser/Thr kinase [Ruminococcus sp.]|uniref:Stk1 family PASTA domain-containing Ser/Thr kinase n=1 Tax=Ruminococcus sp. TaxID=41978 RepID=UPI0026363402|nr:Stk1 family PASTA domain-containing Ser/Thr kinase [Ruminococcus sp.]MDD6989275.1 Stk1 family PASTA domain-containing Ser/Thr kinase [Ruminococcus sp.]MDY6202129.1 Stk1 family PASTA domain-containing Ser/Thr kinase [Ruminococcus sp.]